jgi:hypothetical protein
MNSTYKAVVQTFEVIMPQAQISAKSENLRTFSIMWYSREHDVSETGSVSVLRCLLPYHLRTETDPVSETSYSLEYQTMDKVQKPSNSVWYTPSSEPFRIYLKILFRSIL